MYLEQIKGFVHSFGFTVSEFIQDNSWHDVACEVTGTKLHYAFLTNKKGQVVFKFGAYIWGTRELKTWTSHENISILSTEEKAEAKRQKAEREKLLAHTAELVFKESCVENPTGTTYLSRKWPLHAIPHFLYSWEKDINHSYMMKVPMTDLDGKIWNVQHIQTDGTKRNLGGRTKGLICSVEASEGKSRETLYLCEGLATAMTVAEAMRAEAWCVFGTGGFDHVLSELKKRKRKDVVCVLDNDWDKSPNAGSEALKQLQSKYVGVSFVQPRTGLLGPGMSDYNDVLVAMWNCDPLTLIYNDIESQLLSPPKNEEPMQQEFTEPHATQETPSSGIGIVKTFVNPYRNGVDILPPKYSASGKLIPHEDLEVAHHIMTYWEGELCKCEGSLFQYNGSHWEEISKEDESIFYRQAAVAMNGLGGDKKFSAILRVLKNLVPTAPKNMLTPNPYMINLKNGTLHILKNDNGKWCLDFRPKNPLDYCINTIPIDYDQTRSTTNTKFNEMISNILGDDQEQIRIVKQMYGACLAPIFPRLFMLLGRKGSGKSSLIKGAMALVSPGNYSSVQPRDFKDPYMETMVGKIVNVVTDIDEETPIQDSVVKQIEDRVPILTNRKYKKAVSVPLPAVHLFGGNSMPPARNGRTMAHTRRWSFLKIEKFDSEGADKDIDVKDFANIAVAHCPSGVLNFALEGLEDLLNSGGKYFAGYASIKIVNAWQTESSPFHLFLEACRDNETGQRLVLREDGRALKTEIWSTFVHWFKDAYQANPKVKKMLFFSWLDGAKFEGQTFISVKIRGERYIKGFYVAKNLEDAENLKNEKSARGAENVGHLGQELF